MAAGADRPGRLNPHAPGVLAGAGRLARPDRLCQHAAARPGRRAGPGGAGGRLHRRRRRRRAWPGRLALGDKVTVRASPRSGKLLSLVAEQDAKQGAAPGPPGAGEDRLSAPASDADRPGRAPAAEGDEGAEPPGALLAAGEVSAAVGRRVQATGATSRAASTVYRGEGLTIIVKAADGVLRGLTSLARRRGRPLPEVGDEAWSLNRGRTAVLRVGELTAKVTIGGSAARSLPPDALPKLAATVAERLPAHASS